MKRVLSVLLILLLLPSLALLCAAETPLTVVGAEDVKRYVIDFGELLSDEEEARLDEKAAEISGRQGMDLVILTVDDLDGKSAMAYADDYFDYNGYGQGDERSGLLLLLSMADRDWWISTRGSAIQAFTDDGIQYVFDKAKSDISGGRYAQGFDRFLDTADTMMSAYNGTLSEEALDEFQTDFNQFAGYNQEPVRQKPGIVKTTVIALIAGFVLAFIPSSFLRSELKSVRSNYSASNYRRPDSMHLDRNRDIYLYANTTSRVIETQRSSGGGGSSTHVSSSGATHGGGGGKF